MLIWANENEIDTEMTKDMCAMYEDNPGFRLINFKPWELSVILRQIRIHFGDRKDISLLDFGTGRSPFGAYLDHLGYRFVTCLDKKRGWHRSRKIDQEKYNEQYNAHVKYIKTNIILDYDEWHDVIFSNSVLEHIEEKERIEVMWALAGCLKPDGLIIHVVDYVLPEYGKAINIKELIDNCGVPVSYRPEETPGCKEFKGPPEYTWWYEEKLSRVAFFNERKNE